MYITQVLSVFFSSLLSLRKIYTLHSVVPYSIDVVNYLGRFHIMCICLSMGYYTNCIELDAIRSMLPWNEITIIWNVSCPIIWIPFKDDGHILLLKWKSSDWQQMNNAENGKTRPSISGDISISEEISTGLSFSSVMLRQDIRRFYLYIQDLFTVNHIIA